MTMMPTTHRPTGLSSRALGRGWAAASTTQFATAIASPTTIVASDMIGCLPNAFVVKRNTTGTLGEVLT